MTMKYSLAVRNNRLDALDVEVGAAAFLEIYSGTTPASANDSAAGNTIIASIPLNNPAFNAASNGVITLATGTPLSTTATGTGTATFFRLNTTAGATTAVAQGDVGVELTLSKNPIDSGDQVDVTSFQITAGGA